MDEAEGTDVLRLEVPPETLRMQSQTLALIARRRTFTLYPVSSELTTKQAAEVLGVSRPHLIRVRESGGIPSEACHSEAMHVLMGSIFSSPFPRNRIAPGFEYIRGSEISDWRNTHLRRQIVCT